MGMLDGMFGGGAGQQGLLAGSMALLNAGGPSRMPVSLGQALGQGMGAGQKAYQDAQEFELQKQYRGAQIQKMKDDAEERKAGAAWDVQAREMLNSGDTAGLKKFAMAGALRAKPGALQLLKMVEDREKEESAEADWKGYQSQITPAVQAAPALVVGKPGEDAMATDAANPISRPAVIAKPESRSGGLFGTYATHPDSATSTAGLQAQGLLDSSRVPRQKWLEAMQGRLATMDQNYRNREDKQVEAGANDARDAANRAAMIRLAAGLRAPTPESPPVQIMQDGKPIWASRVNAIGKEAVRTGGSARQASVEERHLGSQFNAAVKPIETQLSAINGYHDVRKLDSAQAAQVAADLLRQASKSGNVRFKGEAEKLLGGGYGSGDLYSRMENFLSQQVKGRPSEDVMKRLDALVGAMDGAAKDNLADQTKRFAGQARGKDLDAKRVIGMPRVLGTTVILPDGVRKNFNSADIAMKYAQEWEDNN